MHECELHAYESACVGMCMTVCENVCLCVLSQKLEDNLWGSFSPTTVSPRIKLRTLDLASLLYFAVLFSPFLFKGTFLSSARLRTRCHFLRIIMLSSSRICTQKWVFISQEVTVSETQE